MYYDVLVMEKDGTEFCFQNVEGLGLLLEYEHLSDFENVPAEDILEEKKNMLEIIKSYGLDISENSDVKKAYELIKLNLERKD